MTTVACGATIVFVVEDGGHGRVFEGVRAYVAHSWRIMRGDIDVRRWLVANAAWEGFQFGAIFQHNSGHRIIFHIDPAHACPKTQLAAERFEFLEKLFENQTNACQRTGKSFQKD